jgi:hypothetical protein
LQNFALVSGIEAPPSTRLFNLWIEQKIGGDVNLRLGQFSAAQEFLVGQTAALFVNATFGWPMLPAQDLPSGGPFYPEATPGVRVTWTPTVSSRCVRRFSTVTRLVRDLAIHRSKLDQSDPRPARSWSHRLRGAAGGSTNFLLTQTQAPKASPSASDAVCAKST